MLFKFIKRPLKFLNFYLPKSLYKRFVLIIVLPVFLIQIGSLSFFINRNWIKNSNKYIENVVQQILFVKNVYEQDHVKFASLENNFLKLNFKEVHSNQNRNIKIKNINLLNLHIIKKVLKKYFFNNFSIARVNNNILITIKTKKHFLEFKVDTGDILFSSNHVYIFFNILLSLLFLAIAWLFMKNQVIPIVELSKSMHNFSENHKSVIMKPKGALEIKNAINSFNAMSQEIMNYISEQNIALAGISHDIKTYLTRMKLEIALLDNSQLTREINADITEMDNMVSEFIEYAKSELHIIAKTENINIPDLIRDVLCKFQIKNQMDCCGDIFLYGNINSLKRCFLNIISNSEKFATFLKIKIQQDKKFVYIYFDDNGPGVDDEDLEFLLKPFFKSDKSRNMNKGGVGLGLSIADNIISKHNGEIFISRSKEFSGLNITIKFKKL